MTKPSVVNISGIEAYLEGIKVPFNSIQISEAEGSIPSASITFAADAGALRLLATTLLQIFGNVPNEIGNGVTSVLLFEGELTGIDYFKDPSFGNQVVARFTHPFSKMLSARLKPSDSIITKQKELAASLQKTNVIILSDKTTDKILSSDLTSNDIKTYEEKSNVEITGLLSKLGSFTKIGGLADEFSRLLQDEKINNGNFQLMIETFNKFFELNDLYYGITSNSLKLSKSIFSFPNPGISKVLQLKATWEAFSDFLQNTKNFTLSDKGIYTLYEVLEKFQQYMMYQFIVPAAPTAAKLFFTDLPIKNYYPLRGYYFPNIENGPPILTNIFFPKQVSKLTFSRDLAGEVTRQIAQTHWSFTGSNSLPEWINPIYVLPDIDIIKNNNGEVESSYTREESYRGINIATITYDGLITKTLSDNSLKIDTNTGKEVSGKSVSINDSTGEIMRVFAIDQYLHNRYSKRLVRLSTTWNPFRMIGMPGLVFEEGYPSIVGIVSTINTTITANGIASEVTLRNCRIIHDDDIGSVFNPLLDKKEEVTGLDKYIINDLSTDKITSVNEYIYDNNLYSFRKIGEDVYTYLVKGTSHINRQFSKFSSIKPSIYSNYENNLSNNPEIFPNDEKIDYSILRFIKQKNENSAAINLITQYSSKINYPVPDEILYTLDLYESIEALKKQYKNIILLGEQSENSSILDKYMNSINWRKLLTKEEYKTFTNISFDQNNHFRDTKDLYYILKNNKREDIVSYIKNKSNNVVTENFMVSDSTTYDETTIQKNNSLFKPFNIIRRAHVINAFKKYLKTFISSNKKTYIVST